VVLNIHRLAPHQLLLECGDGHSVCIVSGREMDLGPGRGYQHWEGKAQSAAEVNKLRRNGRVRRKRDDLESARRNCGALQRPASHIFAPRSFRRM